MKNDNLKEQYRINERIRVREVRLVGDNIETGVYPIAQALKIAEEQGMDLVEISPNAAPPVCRVIDYQKFLYQQKKRQKEQKAKSVKVVVKEIRFGPQTDDHDYNFKLKHAKGFLEEGSKVKAYVFFKGRSILFKEQGEVLLLRFANDLEDYGKVEQLPALAYARYLNCTNRTETDACGRCPSCLKYDELAHPDLHFVFPIVAKKEKKKEVCDDYLSEWRGFLKEHPYFNMDEWLDYIEAGNSQAIIYSKESDEIIHKLSLKIYEAEYRILMVWLPEKLHPTCANKLLKIIEEPPMKTVILMVSETPDLILGTIQSRAQRIHIRPIETDAIMNAMVSRFGLSPDDAKHVAHLSSGSFIKAMEAISLGEENKFFLEQFKAMMRNSWARNVKGMKAMADVMAGIGRERQKNFLSYCQHLIRENFMYRFQSPELNYMNLDEASFSVKFSPFVNERNVIDLMEELAKAERHITQNVNAKMVFFDLSLRITVLIKR